ncbi:hypothetical protein B0T19DRAFT_13862 [Cercophora scortea]|uniref:Uncharacterized protein n=1 Tax=Cercophora scortea TaxID=314031 RepID=A0AAE0J331_9PEZI|nr:hypothetical protein B0T19DRAFT_13862 [Cercophora scortea]
MAQCCRQAGVLRKFFCFAPVQVANRGKERTRSFIAEAPFHLNAIPRATGEEEEESGARDCPGCPDCPGRARNLAVDDLTVLSGCCLPCRRLAAAAQNRKEPTALASYHSHGADYWSPTCCPQLCICLSLFCIHSRPHFPPSSHTTPFPRPSPLPNLILDGCPPWEELGRKRLHPCYLNTLSASHQSPPALNLHSKAHSRLGKVG